MTSNTLELILKSYKPKVTSNLTKTTILNRYREELFGYIYIEPVNLQQLDKIRYYDPNTDKLSKEYIYNKNMSTENSHYLYKTKAKFTINLNTMITFKNNTIII